MPCRRVPSANENLTVALTGSKCRDTPAALAMGLIRAKRTAQALLFVAAVAYMSLLLYQSVSALGSAQQVCSKAPCQVSRRCRVPNGVPSGRLIAGGVAAVSLAGSCHWTFRPQGSWVHVCQVHFGPDCISDE
jgi:hypothetical protein